MQVRFNLKEPKGKKPTLVFAFLSYNNKRLKYSTQLEIHPKYWNKKTQRIKKTSSFPTYPEINHSLDQLANKIVTR